MKKIVFLLITLLSAAVFALELPEASGYMSIDAVLEQEDLEFLPDDTGPPGDTAKMPDPDPAAREPHPAGNTAKTISINPVTEPEPLPEPAQAAARETVPEIQTEPPAPPHRRKPTRGPRMYARSPLSSAWVFPAGYISYNIRNGYRKYDGVEEYQHVSRNDMFIYGGAVGKRFALKNPRLRIQTTVETGWGSSEENSFQALYSDGVTRITYEYIYLWTVGAQTDMHVLFPINNNSRMLFISFGPGVHNTAFHHKWKLKSGQEIAETNEISITSFSANIGIGMERKISRHRAASFSYNFRFWKPINYMDIGDMFPMGVEYDEFFFSHALQVQILLPARWAIGFR